MRGRRARPSSRKSKESAPRQLSRASITGLTFLLSETPAKEAEAQVVGARAALIKQYGARKGASIWRELKAKGFVSTGERAGRMAKTTVRRLAYEQEKARSRRALRRRVRKNAQPAPDIATTIAGVIDRFDTAMAEIEACQALLSVHGLTATRNEEGITVLMRAKRVR